MKPTFAGRSPSHNERLVIDFFNVYVNRNYEALPELIAERYADHSPAQARNPEDVANTLRLVARAFPDLCVEVLDIFGSDDRVAVRVRFTGTHAATFMDVPASNRLIVWEALEIFRIRSARIEESWGYWPDHSMTEQMKATERGPDGGTAAR